MGRNCSISGDMSILFYSSIGLTISIPKYAKKFGQFTWRNPNGWRHDEPIYLKHYQLSFFRWLKNSHLKRHKVLRAIYHLKKRVVMCTITDEWKPIQFRNLFTLPKASICEELPKALCGLRSTTNNSCSMHGHVFHDMLSWVNTYYRGCNCNIHLPTRFQTRITNQFHKHGGWIYFILGFANPTNDSLLRLHVWAKIFGTPGSLIMCVKELENYVQ